MKKAIWLLVFLFVLSLAAGVSAAPFADVPSDHWAYDAVSQLAAKGLLEGYPDGLYRGDRAASRYEMAMVTARMLAKLESFRGEVTKEDLEALRKLVNEFRDELDALGVRLKNAEDAIASLEKRVTEVERVSWSGLLYSVATATGTDMPRNGQAATDSTVANLNLQIGAVDFTEAIKHRWKRHLNAYPLVDGSGMSSVGYLGIKAKMSDQFIAGGTVGLYNAIENNVNSLFWGVTAPYNLNRTISLAGAAVGAGNVTQAALDQVWGRYSWGGAHKGWTKLQFGSFTPGADDAGWVHHVSAFHAAKEHGDVHAHGVKHGEESERYDGGEWGNVTRDLAYPSDIRSHGHSDWFTGGMDYLYTHESDNHLFGSHMFLGQPDFSYVGPGHLPLYGVRTYGEVEKFGVDKLRWEAFLSRLQNRSVFTGFDPFGNLTGETPAFGVGLGSITQSELFGAGVGFDFEALDRKGSLDFSWLRAIDERSPGGLLGADGNIGFLRPGLALLTGAGPVSMFTAGSGMNNYLPWNLPEPTGVVTPAIAVGGNFLAGEQSRVGPQDQDMWGLDLKYQLINEVGFRAEFCNSEYTPSRLIRAFVPAASGAGVVPAMPAGATGGSGVSASGTLFDVGLYGTIGIDDKWKVHWTGKWISVDPDYDPYMAYVPNYPWGGGAGAPNWTNGIVQSLSWMAPYMHMFPGGYFLHNSVDFPQNREGWKLNFQVPLPEDRGNVWMDVSGLEQKNSSNIANLSQIGFTEPQFMSMSQIFNLNDFNGVAVGSIDTNGNGVLDAADIRYDPNGQVVAGTGTLVKGSTFTWSLGGTYNVPSTDFSVRGVYRFWNWDRKTNVATPPAVLVAGLNFVDPRLTNGAPSMDNIDLDWNLWSIGATYQWTPKFSVFADYYSYDWNGRYLWPAGNTYNNGIINIPNSKNVDMTQTGWALGARFEFTKDAEVFVRYKVLDTNDKTRGAWISSVTAGGVVGTAQEWDWDSQMFTAATRIRF